MLYPASFLGRSNKVKQRACGPLWVLDVQPAMAKIQGGADAFTTRLKHVQIALLAGHFCSGAKTLLCSSAQLIG